MYLVLTRQSFWGYHHTMPLRKFKRNLKITCTVLLDVRISFRDFIHNKVIYFWGYVFHCNRVGTTALGFSCSTQLFGAPALALIKTIILPNILYFNLFLIKLLLLYKLSKIYMLKCINKRYIYTWIYIYMYR